MGLFMINFESKRNLLLTIFAIIVIVAFVAWLIYFLIKKRANDTVSLKGPKPKTVPKKIIYPPEKQWVLGNTWLVREVDNRMEFWQKVDDTDSSKKYRKYMTIADSDAPKMHAFPPDIAAGDLPPLVKDVIPSSRDTETLVPKNQESVQGLMPANDQKWVVFQNIGSNALVFYNRTNSTQSSIWNLNPTGYTQNPTIWVKAAAGGGTNNAFVLWRKSTDQKLPSPGNNIPAETETKVSAKLNALDGNLIINKSVAVMKEGSVQILLDHEDEPFKNRHPAQGLSGVIQNSIYMTPEARRAMLDKQLNAANIHVAETEKAYTMLEVSVAQILETNKRALSELEKKKEEAVAKAATLTGAAKNAVVSASAALSIKIQALKDKMKDLAETNQRSLQTAKNMEVVAKQSQSKIVAERENRELNQDFGL
jgi:hypothetical protein